MSSFELVLALLGLLLGLATAEVLGGFARVLKVKRLGRVAVRIGWLTPLLGLLVILDQTSFWLVAWHLRDLIHANALTLYAVMAIVGTYYLASTLIFPDDPASWPDFDEHYDRQNHLVLGAILLAYVAIFVLAAVLRARGVPIAADTHLPPAFSAPGLFLILGTYLTLALLIALILVKSRRANVAMLAVLIGIKLATAVIGAVT